MIKKTINIGPILDFKKWMVRCIWVETVFSEIDNFCAISLLDNPLLHLIKNILRRASGSSANNARICCSIMSRERFSSICGYSAAFISSFNRWV